MSTIRTTYVITISLSAFLLFLIQPMIGKHILPVFGGTPAVWSTSLLFFMTVLLFGYVYAHILSKFERLVQITVQSMLLIVAGAFIVGILFSPQQDLLPALDVLSQSTHPPVVKILLALTVSIGLPYFILSTTSTLLQYWYGQLGSRQPYKFYIFSNIASIGAVAAYPFIIEPLFPLNLQATLWSYAYALFVLCFALAYWQYVRQSKKNEDSKHETFGSHLATNKPTYRRVVLWVSLGALTGLLLVSTTTQLTLAVAPVPLLWLIPLLIYLLSFVIAFSDLPLFRGFAILTFLTATTTFFLSLLAVKPLIITLIVYSLFLFLATVGLHRALYDRRPEVNQLTLFYLALSLGSVLGGIFASIIAPLIFTTFVEWQIGILASGIAFYLLYPMPRLSARFGTQSISLYLVIYVVITIYLGTHLYTQLHERDVALRNFFGTLSVKTTTDPKTEEQIRTLIHGEIQHGNQFLSTERADIPTTYYGTESGVGRGINYLRNQQSDDQGLQIGIVGLGAGTLAAYCQENDTFVFYEINPDVILIAERDFTYLERCSGDVRIILGDARISLTAEQSTDQRYDMLVIDAFSDDAIPVHLITKEAMELYLSRLTDEGVLAMHISNQHLNLMPLMNAFAQEFSLSHVHIDVNEATTPGAFSSEWTLFSRNQSLVENKIFRSDAEKSVLYEQTVSMWTDQYSHLLSVIGR